MVALGKKAKAASAKATDPEPSAGVADYGKGVSMGLGATQGFVYLTCEATMNVTATITVTMTGTAAKAYTCAKEMTVKPVAKAAALTGAAAVVGPTV